MGDVVGMRNRLIHGYYDVDFNQVWLTVTEDLPLLIAELEKEGVSKLFTPGASTDEIITYIRSAVKTRSDNKQLL